LEPFTSTPWALAAPTPPKKARGEEITSAQGQEITKTRRP
jgi:hypothetical protein